MRIGCCAITEDLQTVREQGYDYIELAAKQLMSLDEAEFRSFLLEFRETGLPCVGFNSVCGEELPIVGPEQNLDALKDYMKRLCERGRLLGIRSIGIGAPGARRPPEDWPLHRSDEQMKAFLQMACEVAKDAGIAILLEAVNAYDCGYLHHTDHAADIIRELKIGNLGMVLDYYQVKLEKEDPEALGFAMPFVRHLHVSGGLPRKPRTFPKTEEDAAEQKVECRCAFRQGYAGDTVSVEADRSFLREDGIDCLQLLRSVWGSEN